MILVMGDFNAHYEEWYEENSTDRHVKKIKDIFDSFDISQIVKEPTHFTNVGSGHSRTLIDLVSTNQPNFIFKSRVDPPPDSTCKHHINHIELGLRIPIQKHITKQIWHYGRADSKALYNSCKLFDWKRALSGISIDEAVELLTIQS